MTFPKPLLSIVIITYNHEKYIEETLEGIKDQQCDFHYEIVISNDCSSDNTDELINLFIKNNPQYDIKYFNQKKNIGIMPNFIFALDQAKGKYIATCEGDDYWIDPCKSQIQVDFLEANDDFNFSVGKVYKLLDGKKKFQDRVDPVLQSEYFLKDYLKGVFSQTSSFVFRNNFKIPDWFQFVHAGDQSLVVIVTKDKKIKYHDHFFSVYRINSGSISNNTDIKIAYKKSIFFLDSINNFTEKKYKRYMIARKINNYLFYQMKKMNNPVIDVFFKGIMFTISKFISKI